MSKKTKVISDNKRLLDCLKNNIRFLTETDLQSIEDGNIEQLTKSLDIISEAGRFTPKTREDIERPDKFLLKVIRDPNNFPFTCEHVFNTKILPFQNLFLRELWYRPFPMLIASRGGGKSFILALYVMMRALLNQGCKIVIVGASFRQSKVIFDYCVKIWMNSPILRDICGTKKGPLNKESGPIQAVDQCSMVVGDSVIVALPIGDGSKIRGQRANYIVADEFASINVEIYETVIKGFGSVAQDPVAAIEKESWVRALKGLGLWDEALEKEYLSTRGGNQAVISGTADYSFENFARYWKRHKAIIESRGDTKKLTEVVGQDAVKDLNYRDYSIIRVPIELIPRGFMDARYIASTKATVHTAIYQKEYGTVFVSDSDGFYKQSLISKNTCGNPLSNIPFEFAPQLRGDPGVQHIFAVDPASERDNFAVTILAIHKDHRRIVHVWTTNKKFHKERIKAGLIKEHNFYGFAARKIRELMLSFSCERIMVDSQGGGAALREAFADRDKLHDDELPILEIIDPEKEKDSDTQRGLHILEMVQFASADWTSEANHGLKKDLEDGILLFPKFDPILLELSYEQDKLQGRISTIDGKEIKLYDTLEDVYMEIEELKRELVTIVHTKTANSGRERWDTPEVKAANAKVGRMRKDRYSALLMANMGCRQYQRTPKEIPYQSIGGFSNDMFAKHDGGSLYYGGNADWYQSAGFVGGVVNKNG